MSLRNPATKCTNYLTDLQTEFLNSEDVLPSILRTQKHQVGLEFDIY